jgi:3-oxoacyl-[acyl-carrier-protein] synthase-3
MIYLHGIGHYHPDNIITNRFLEELDIGTSEEWILERVGIHTRRSVLPLDYIRQTKNRDHREAYLASSTGNTKTGAAAARMALARAGLGPGDIGLVISGSSIPDTLTPAEAATIAAELGIEAPCFDLNSACSTFGVQINFLSRMRPEAVPLFVLLVQPENLTRSIDYSDRANAVLFGDGSSAAVVSAVVPAAKIITHSDCGSKPSAWDKARVPRNGYFWQDGSAVQGFAIRRTTDSVRILQNQAVDNGHRLIFLGHQANLGMLQSVCGRCGIAEEDHWHNVEFFGNQGSAGGPAVLSQHWDDLQPGDQIAVALVGAGLTWGHMLLSVTGQGTTLDRR